MRKEKAMTTLRKVFIDFSFIKDQLPDTFVFFFNTKYRYFAYSSSFLLKCATCVLFSRPFPLLSGKLTNLTLSSWWRPMCEEKKFCLFPRFSAFSENIWKVHMQRKFLYFKVCLSREGNKEVTVFAALKKTWKPSL